MTTPLVRGMPYVSAVYAKMTPRVTLPSSPLKTLNGEPLTTASLSGSRFELRLANGQTWVLYAEHHVHLSVEGSTLTFDAPYDGTLRAAVVTSDTSDLLDAYAARVPLSGAVHAESHGDHATLTFSFVAKGEGRLLMMALPHHLDQGHLGGVARTKLVHSTLKGDMMGVVGDTWTLFESLPPVEFGAPRPIESSRKAAIREALKADKEKPLLVPDPYGAGKEMGAVGRLALIADELGENATATALRGRLAKKLEEWLKGDGKDPLQYEPTYGGLVSADGLADRAADFGGGWYNDHHFHYGYFLYAAAAVGRKDPAWLKQWAPAIAHLIRDIANPSADDPLYPPQRFKDWYVGHSWASGLFPSASGRNQESVSEALNAWYGLALYGKVLGDEGLCDLGRLMLATEMRSGWKYWQIDKESTIYPAEFRQNGLAAVVWSTKVDKTTWFGANVEYSYGIQAMPVTPITEMWLRPEWLASTLPVWGAAMDSATEQWRGILLMMAAINQPDEAWKNAFLLTLFDNGNSKTNVLYWIATRGKAACTLPECALEAIEPPALAVPPSPPLSTAAPHAITSNAPATPEATDPPAPLTMAEYALLFLAVGFAVLIGKRYADLRATQMPQPVSTAPETEAEYHQL